MTSIMGARAKAEAREGSAEAFMAGSGEGWKLAGDGDDLRLADGKAGDGSKGGDADDNGDECSGEFDGEVHDECVVVS